MEDKREYRREFEAIIHNGKAAIKITDNYLAPTVVNITIFVFEPQNDPDEKNIKGLHGYAFEQAEATIKVIKQGRLDLLKQLL